jgi:hypothetical protein
MSGPSPWSRREKEVGGKHDVQHDVTTANVFSSELDRLAFVEGHVRYSPSYSWFYHPPFIERMTIGYTPRPMLLAGPDPKHTETPRSAPTRCSNSPLRLITTHVSPLVDRTLTSDHIDICLLLAQDATLSHIALETFECSACCIDLTPSIFVMLVAALARYAAEPGRRTLPYVCMRPAPRLRTARNLGEECCLSRPVPRLATPQSLGGECYILRPVTRLVTPQNLGGECCLLRPVPRLAAPQNLDGERCLIYA